MSGRRRSGRGPWLAVLALLVLFGSAGAAAQERTPAARDQLVELARVLGESHALRQTCRGGEDQYWRARMQQLLLVEAADERLVKRLKESFNAGYDGEKALYGSCTADARQEARRLASRGQTLSSALAGP